MSNRKLTAEEIGRIGNGLQGPFYPPALEALQQLYGRPDLNFYCKPWLDDAAFSIERDRYLLLTWKTSGFGTGEAGENLRQWAAYKFNVDPVRPQDTVMLLFPTKNCPDREGGTDTWCHIAVFTEGTVEEPAMHDIVQAFHAGLARAIEDAQRLAVTPSAAAPLPIARA